MPNDRFSYEHNVSKNKATNARSVWFYHASNPPKWNKKDYTRGITSVEHSQKIAWPKCKDKFKNQEGLNSTEIDNIFPRNYKLVLSEPAIKTVVQSAARKTISTVSKQFEKSNDKNLSSFFCACKTITKRKGESQTAIMYCIIKVRGY